MGVWSYEKNVHTKLDGNPLLQQFIGREEETSTKT
jgi:hypothetical protein